MARRAITGWKTGKVLNRNAAVQIKEAFAPAIVRIFNLFRTCEQRNDRTHLTP